MTLYTASQRGEHPPGLHWTEGESRLLTPEQAEELPRWLRPEVSVDADEPVVAVPPPLEKA